MDYFSIFILLMDNITEYQTIGDRITFLIGKLGLKNKEFADQIEVDASQLSKIKSNTAGLPSNLPGKLYDKWKINLHWLFTGEGEWRITPREAGESNRVDVMAHTGDRIMIIEAKLYERTEAHIADLKKHNEDLNKIIHSGLVEIKGIVFDVSTNLKEAREDLKATERGQRAASTVMMKALDGLVGNEIGTLAEESNTLERDLEQLKEASGTISGARKRRK
jgi:hypothetical protein